ncbi:TM0106 family RecB-like putative nuclease [Agrobacterium sp. lyk4-40-TYG-31]|uniref:TM0106 family RecB-like putative nuclease n=1 Tax=Agrobacterium sp. lyk4-40-TYG-31 TaxID=3040276 RepID=UPI00254AC4F5|nr:TM0106 family RecB-like putative nuclease [Agrobacterium sp. lyk4-40-TYG-31]
MQLCDDSLRLSATDLVGHLNCRHLTGLDIEVARGTLSKPAFWDPLLQILWERGARHEQDFVNHLKAQGLDVTVIEGVEIEDDAVVRTRAAMVDGHPIIVQGAFRLNEWVGRTDILRRIEMPSDLGAWSYEVIDTKLARETKGGTVLQLCLYAELVASVQGLTPEYSYVVAPWSDYEPQIFRMDDYAAYYRRVRDGLTHAIRDYGEQEIYPDPKSHCDICRWQDRCDQRRRDDDHLSLIAGISKVQIDELKRQGINTAADLAVMSLPLAWKPTRGAANSYERIREQARIQVEGREAGTVIHELLPVVPGFGLANLPAPSSGDIFFDLEGDPFAGEVGLEYLFGYSFADTNSTASYTCNWAFTREEEKANFERFIDFVMARLEQHPDLHIYHFAPYEPAALKRLMGRYASREEEIDFLLRSKRFVDLYGVVRNALRASVESYSIKKLEPLYGFTRDTKLSDANMALAKVQACLELGNLELIDDADRTVVAGYNRDDCVSTWQLRDWLESRRDELVAAGTDVPRPQAPEGAPSEKLSEWQEKIHALIDQLTGDVPLDPADRTPEQHARWLLAHSLDWHRREQKALWWEYFRLSDLAAEDLLEERAGLSGLSFIGATGGTAKAPIHRYSFPPQETELRGGESLRNMGGAHFGTVEEMALDERWVDIKKRGDTADVHSEAVFAHKVIDADVLAKALVRIGEHVAANGMEGDGPYRAARDLLMRILPRIGGQPIRQDRESTLDAALRIAPHLQPGVFPIQGPPGAGKTHTGGRMICALVQAGKTVGVTANSHKVIRNLLDAVVTAADEMGVNVQCMQKPADKEDDVHRLRFTTKPSELLGAIGQCVNVGGGTAWLWASPDAAESVDVLFIDEAAQMALANVLAVSQAASTIVLLGDPQQLDQPMQGSHPEGTDVSSLHHILGDDQTISDDRGLFLAETWRLHPDICAYTSELFYGGRLHPRQGLEVQEIRSGGRVSGAGLRYVPVPSDGNQSASPEEAECIRDLVDEILETATTWIDKHGVEAPVTLNEILIIAPYNAQVIELQDRIPGGRIGTVDKFQGQEAPIVIYSMTTSSYSDAPRGMEFLYSLNRLNVATSRAKCICVLVASPSVFEAQCRTPRQMQLANAFCRYLERAIPVHAGLPAST